MSLSRTTKAINALMLTFTQFIAQGLDEGILDRLKNRLFKKKPSKKRKDSPHYKTDHHYGHGDIDPATIPIFKPSF